MIAPIWDRIPGPWWVKLPLALALIALCVFALVQWVFPLLDPIFFPAENPTVGPDAMGCGTSTLAS